MLIQYAHDLGTLLAWLDDAKPDIVLLQETKVVDDAFPALEIEDKGYNIAVHGQKTYNGVAILSKGTIEDITRGLPGDDSDEQARYIEAITTIDNTTLRVASAYVPNGSEVGSEKFAYKMRFFERLRHHLFTLLEWDEMLVIGGDYNVAPEIIDVYAPDKLDGTVCFHPDERAWFRQILHLGFVDTFRASHPDTQQFSWWDYRGGAWQQNKGMRIDHLLLSPQSIDKLTISGVDHDMRSQSQPSDHVPVWCELGI